MVVRRFTLCAVMVLCLAFAGPAWAGALQFTGDNLSGQGLLSFTPGAGAQLTIGSGNGGNGALITDFLNGAGVCSGNCSITAGYLTLTTGTEASSTFFPGGVTYGFNSGGSIKITGGIPLLSIANGSTLFSANFLPGGEITIFGGSGSFAGGVNLASVVLNPLLGTYQFSAGHDNDFAFNIDPACATGGSCTGTISQSTLQLMIPEPATLSVLGVGLFAFGAGLRRKMAGKLGV